MFISVATKPINRTRPVELVREYIEDCLYNKNYGYFSKMVSIVDTGECGIDFASLKNESAFKHKLRKLYGYEKLLEFTEENKFHNKWHTASELFWPWYGHAIGNWLATQASFKLKKGEKLKILEIGAGNGNLCSSVMDYMEKKQPMLFDSMEYHLVDVAESFHQKQLQKLHQKWASKCTFHNNSIFDLQLATTASSEKDYWFILGMEVLDNLPHDRIMYSQENGELLQCQIETNERAKYGQIAFYERFVPLKDKLIGETMSLMDAIGYESPSLKRNVWDLVYHNLGRGNFGVNPWRTEFIPTMAFKLLQKLKRTFPRHSVLFGDFAMLPERIRGHNGPLVQSCLRGETIAVETYLVQRGCFDIMFETNFDLLKKAYIHLTKGEGEVFAHSDLMKKYAPLEKTCLQNKYNPILKEYPNMKYFIGSTEEW